MISHQYRCVFVHIPKTAGKSILRFFGMDWQKHKDLSRYAQKLEPQVFASYFKFAIVRNPRDRILSDYNFQKKKKSPTDEKLFTVDERGRTRRFVHWVETALLKDRLPNVCGLEGIVDCARGAPCLACHDSSGAGVVTCLRRATSYSCENEKAYPVS